MPGPKLSQPTNVVRRSTRVSLAPQKLTSTTSFGRQKSTLGLPKNTGSIRNENVDINKRKAEKSPTTKQTVKRSAFGDITNDVPKKNVGPGGKPGAKETGAVKKAFGTIMKRQPLRSTTNTVAPAPPAAKKPTAAKVQAKAALVIPKVTTTAAARKQAVKQVEKEVVAGVATLALQPQAVGAATLQPEAAKPPLRRSARLSDTGNSSGDSLFYVTALEELNITNSDKKSDKKESLGPCVPEGVEDFDKICAQDPGQVSDYAFDIFSYLKSREARYMIPAYIERQPHITKYMRSVLVDWMVEVQENFELNHETLYLGVKLVDSYLSKKSISKDNLQLVGAVSLFIACKYEERCPPSVEEFVFICDNAYAKSELLDMEFSFLEVLDFDLGYPLSYRFLRRYARCVKTEMPLLTLARYVLEYSLMDHSTVSISDSKLAAASLHIARIMNNGDVWSPALEYYSGYKLDDFKDIAFHLNDYLHKKPKEALKSIKNKYSQDVFFEVTKTPLVGNNKL
ncbi:G2/mitotic-specific cyclin-B3 [Nilaparvata lugens]|uniref:G2/mitotic-specific cyclin-B3 n=1 Tax=Nilaparvata lugens TaxID=108931 RepID=UPI00193E9D5E|nr:G2/mitotic-specific cyclin-B3 [Nilaparvata lugens]